ncbi:CoF synthetase [Aquimarina sp. 2201CG14-23]|uniref:CoF synthetase n=1 Tax=Aquimarina mycalae TaxID=3040073 RepID=UPI0024782CC0|nr:CoF synthetase [Aquimarina sp. 2201CG14-23]MDH7444009.1 CoF synthetase [Aquimarina sp. 2201CG14-23]
MNLSQIFRRKIFWLLDALKGNDIRKHYKDIKELIENPESKLSQDTKDVYLQQILAHAVSTTWFYQKYTNYNSILDFPVINKNMIRDNFDEFVSSKYNPDSCVLVSTSGSTGAPFSVLQDINKRCRSTGDNLYFSKRSGYEIGQKLMYIKIWPDTIKRTLFSKFWWQNVYPQSVFKLTDSDINNFIKDLKKDTSKKSLLGYASSFATICKYLDAVNAPPVSCNMQSVIAMSEGLNPYIRSRMEKYFGVAPVSRYSNNENGILAQEDRNVASKFTINSASYYIEILDLDKDISIGSRKRGRIVVTDLHNYAMPLIRYDTGDVGMIEYNEGGVAYLSSIEGRKLDLIYNTKGEIIPSHVSYKLCKYGEYKQFQLIQYGKKDYLIKLNTDKKVDEAKMLKEYKTYFGQDANIQIAYVDEIPLLSSGKRREVVNSYHVKL